MKHFSVQIVTLVDGEDGQIHHTYNELQVQGTCIESVTNELQSNGDVVTNIVECL